MKKILLFISLFLSFWTTFASSWDENINKSTEEKFSMTEVKVIDNKTLNVIFNKDLLEDTSMFEFLLTNKKDDSKELAITWITLSSSKELNLKTVEPLNSNEEYNLVVAFASDKEWKLIENWVDGMVTFKIPAELKSSNEEIELNAAPPSENSVSTSITPTSVDSAVVETSTGIAPEVAVNDIKNLPKTWSEEVFVLLMALLLGLWFMYIRKKA